MTAGAPEAAATAAGSGTLLELEVDSVAVGGDGVARDQDGRVVFVPRTAPGDRVLARVTEAKERWARAHPVELLAPGLGRRAPPCPYYEACGGCQLQHLTEEAQREARGRAVRDALERIGGIEAEVPLPVGAGSALGYRNRITLTLRRDGGGESGGSGESGAGGVIAGYHRWDDPSALVDVEACPLAEPAVNRAWGALREAWGPGAEALPGGPGDELRITVRAGVEGDVALLVEGGAPDRPGDPERVAGAIGARAYHWRDSTGRRRLSAGEERLPDHWQGIELRLLPEAFLQVNRAVAAEMERHVDALAEPGPGLRALDLYAGVGLRAMRWAEAGADVVAVEADREAVVTGREAAERRGVGRDGPPEEGPDVPSEGRLRLLVGRVEDRLQRLLPADLAVVNPPRAGLSKSVAKVLKAAELDRLLYVSCDPATLARDLKRLGAGGRRQRVDPDGGTGAGEGAEAEAEDGWEVVDVRPFDAFPQTAHVETVVALRRRGTRPDAEARFAGGARAAGDAGPDAGDAGSDAGPDAAPATEEPEPTP